MKFSELYFTTFRRVSFYIVFRNISCLGYSSFYRVFRAEAGWEKFVRNEFENVEFFIKEFGLLICWHLKETGWPKMNDNLNFIIASIIGNFLNGSGCD